MSVEVLLNKVNSCKISRFKNHNCNCLISINRHSDLCYIISKNIHHFFHRMYSIKEDASIY